MDIKKKSLGGISPLRDKSTFSKLTFWCSVSVFIGLSAISQGGVNRFIAGVLISVVLLFYLIVIRTCDANYYNPKKFVSKTGSFSIVSASGTLWCVSIAIYQLIMKSRVVNNLIIEGVSNATIQIIVIISLVIASLVALYGLSVVFNFIYLNIFELIRSFDDGKFGIDKKIAIIINIFFALLIVGIYTNTTAFYGSGYNDVIYGSDSYTLTDTNVWLLLFQSQNDLRQPLYMITAAPFMGVAYILGMILNCFCMNGLAIAYALIQSTILVCSIWLLGCLISENLVIRAMAILLLSISYPFIVFSLCLEQYVSSFFWLILTVAAVMHNHKKLDFMIIGAANGLLTSAFMVIWKKAKSFKEWFQGALKCGCMFLVALFAFGRADIFLNLKANLAEIFQYTGDKLAIIDKFYQYSKFVADCFIGQSAVEKIHNSGFLIWGSSEANTINVLGLTTFILVLTGCIWNRESHLCKVAASWIGFSILLLFVLGWGTSSNALFLYALYFSWAFWVPIFLSLQKIYNKGYKKSVIFISTCLFILMVKFNVTEFIQMLSFAIENYPL